MVEVMEQIERHLSETSEQIRQGVPYRISEAADVGSGVWQGDLGIEIIEQVPRDYTVVVRPTAENLKLVPGDTRGSRHILDSHDGVSMFRKADWGPESLDGPCLIVDQERTIEHPVHGAVIIPAGFTVRCRYQRVWDEEKKKARRAAD